MTLYEINEAIMACVDTETGEIIDFDQLDALSMAKDEKIEAIALYALPTSWSNFKGTKHCPKYPPAPKGGGQ